jgi:hypothetical protein
VQLPSEQNIFGMPLNMVQLVEAKERAENICSLTIFRQSFPYEHVAGIAGGCAFSAF